MDGCMARLIQQIWQKIINCWLWVEDIQAFTVLFFQLFYRLTFFIGKTWKGEEEGEWKIKCPKLQHSLGTEPQQLHEEKLSSVFKPHPFKPDPRWPITPVQHKIIPGSSSCSSRRLLDSRLGLATPTPLTSLVPLPAVICTHLKCTGSCECPPSQVARTYNLLIMHPWTQQSAVQFWISSALSSFISTYSQGSPTSSPVFKNQVSEDMPESFCFFVQCPPSLRMPHCGLSGSPTSPPSPLPGLPCPTHVLLKHTKLSPASEPLHLLFPMPGMLFPRCNRAVSLTFRYQIITPYVTWPLSPSLSCHPL